MAKPFIIEGKAFSKPELEIFCKKKIADQQVEEWEKECYTFILDWLSPISTIHVQTSGSTGKPKKLFLEKKYMEASAMATIDFFKLKPGDSALLCLPVKYIAGKMMIVRALVGGLNLLFTKPSSNFEINDFQKIDFCAMVPNQVAAFLDTIKGVEQLQRIKNLIIGGSFLPKDIESKINNLKTEVWQTYGMTETITHIALRKISGNAEEMYTPLKNVKVWTDDHSRLVIDAEKIGVKQLVTNDLAEMGEKGKFKILGRKDNVVISGGVKFFPEEIEKKLSGFIENDFYISSLPDEKLGRKLVLYIEDDGNLENQVNQLWEKINARLSGFEIPKEIFFCKSFSRTVSGKIMRE
ncbi:MAG TPA: AMP-binding protein [Bacteroidales bacterium]